MYNIIYEMSRQSRFNAWYWMLGAGALGQPRGMVWSRRREEGSGWGTRVCLWQIHFDIQQNQYNIVKFKNKIKKKKKDIDLIQYPPGPSQIQTNLTKVSSYTVVALRQELCSIFFTSHSVPADQYLWLQFRNYGFYFQFYMEMCLWIC